MNNDPHDLETLIKKASRGEILPDAAEAEAKRLGVGPLARKPKESSFDPMSETWWTLPMAIGWIVWRQPRQVLVYWDEYRLQCWAWRWVLGRHRLVQESPATLSLLVRVERRAETAAQDPKIVKSVMSVRSAKSKLWSALRADKVNAIGFDLGIGRRVPIRDFEWLDLDYFEEKGHAVVCIRNTASRSPMSHPGRGTAAHVLREHIGSDAKSRSTVHEYTEVVFKRSELMEMWPSLGSESNETPKIEEKCTPKGTAGTKAKFDWEDVQLFVDKTLNEKGDYCDPNPADDWKAQNDLIRAVLEYMESRPGIGVGNGPSHSTLKARIAPMVAAWRKTSPTAGN